MDSKISIKRFSKIENIVNHKTTDVVNVVKGRRNKFRLKQIILPKTVKEVKKKEKKIVTGGNDFYLPDAPVYIAPRSSTSAGTSWTTRTSVTLPRMFYVRGASERKCWREGDRRGGRRGRALGGRREGEAPWRRR